MKIIFLFLTAASLLFGAYTRNDTLEVVYDDETVLTWQDNAIVSSQLLDWNASIDYCENLDFAGVQDWRLPNRNELTSITDLSTISPSINATFQNTSVAAYPYYWSSTTFAADPIGAWLVSFKNGTVAWNDWPIGYYVRCVRSGHINSAPSDINVTTYPPNVDENNADGALIGTLSATDVDTGDTFTFSLVTTGCANNGSDNSHFTIDGTSLKANGVYDYEATTGGVYTACVQVDDGNGGTYTKELLVTINDVDESNAGLCGSSDGETFIIVPTANLCNPGNASMVTAGVTAFIWNCEATTVGVHTGTSANCSAIRTNDADGDGIPDSTEAANEIAVIIPNSGTSGGNTVMRFSYETTETGGSNSSVPSIVTVTPTELISGNPPVGVDGSLLSAALKIVAISDTNGFTLKIVIYLPSDSANLFTGFWKYGPTHDDGSDHWYDFGTRTANMSIANKEGTGYEISGDGKILTVYLVDGKDGDDDMNENGTIVDDAVPLIRVPAIVPLFGPFGSLFLLALFGFFGLRRLKA